MKIAIQRLKTGNKDCAFYFDDANNPVINIEGIEYTDDTIYEMLESYSSLMKAANLTKAAKMINFLIKGVSFQLIEDIEIFKQKYLDKVEMESGEIPGLAARLNDYGRFDVSRLHSSKLVEGQLLFYVKEDATQLPYQVAFTYPFVEELPKAYYNLLPYTY